MPIQFNLWSQKNKNFSFNLAYIQFELKIIAYIFGFNQSNSILLLFYFLFHLARRQSIQKAKTQKRKRNYFSKQIPYCDAGWWSRGSHRSSSKDLTKADIQVAWLVILTNIMPMKARSNYFAGVEVAKCVFFFCLQQAKRGHATTKNYAFSWKYWTVTITRMKL